MQIIQQLFDIFKNKNNQVDILKLKDFVTKDKQISANCSIFVKKLSMLSQATMSQVEFKQYFNQQLEDTVHFNAVFDSIDKQKTGFISKLALKELLRRQNLEDNLEDMMEVCTQNADKVTREQLRKFLVGK